MSKIKNFLQRLVIAVAFLFMKGSEDMIPMLWCQQIMLGKRTFAQVPRLLKDKVRELLIDSECEDLIEE